MSTPIGRRNTAQPVALRPPDEMRPTPTLHRVHGGPLISPGPIIAGPKWYREWPKGKPFPWQKGVGRFTVNHTSTAVALGKS